MPTATSNFGSQNAFVPGGGSVNPFAPTPTTPTPATPKPSAPAAPTNSALLGTSTASRSAYADNVTKMTAAVANHTAQTPTAPTTTDTNYYLKPGEGVDAYNTRISAYNATKTPPVDGSTPTDNADKKPAATTPTDPNDVLDPTTHAALSDNIASLETSRTNAYSTLQAAQATAANDPALASAISAISAKYDVLINNMREKNRMLLGSQNRNSAASGMMQFASDMNTGFLNDQQGKADARVNDLVAKEQDLILQTQIAYQSKDMKALNEAQSAYDKTNAEKKKAVMDLLKATNDAVKQQQDKQKQEATQKRQAITDDLNKSKGIAQSLAQDIHDSGITDEQQIKDHIDGMANLYGITNPDILHSAVLTAQATISKNTQTAQKTAASLQNTASIIEKRNQIKSKAPGKASNGAPAATVKHTESWLNSTRGEDGYADPNAYKQAFDAWTASGYPAKDFLRLIPPKAFTNPANDWLPKYLSSKTGSASSADKLKAQIEAAIK